MKKTKTTNNTKTAKNNTFETLLRTYEKAVNNNDNETTATALQNLATACVYAVLKKLYNVSCQNVIRNLRNGLTSDIKHLENLAYSINNSSEYQFDKDGNEKRVVIDKHLEETTAKLMTETLTDGLDLVDTAIISIMTETQHTLDRDGKYTRHFMEKPYTIRQLKKKVYIQKADSVNGWETTETTPIQQVFKAIRREIANNRNIETASHKYTYIETLATDTETDTTETAYIRLPKYSGLATPTTDINGKITALTADETTAENMDILLTKLNLSKQQAEILKLRLCGYGYKAIATYMGVKGANIQTQIKRIQEKALAIGFAPKI